jgi:pyrroline-5-carboxylate reductase
MLRGWAAGGLALALDVYEPAPGEDLAGLIGGHGWRLNPEPAASGPVACVLLGVKPQMFGQVLDSTIAPLCGPDTLVISIMAGIALEKLRSSCGTDRAIRAMPNTPGQIGRGITGWVGSPALTPADEALATRLLAPLGTLEKIASERQMDAVTAVSGSGPAYLFLLTEALAAAGEAEGLERGLAERLARATITGSAALMDQSAATPHELRKDVTSPGGTTAAAIDVLTGGGGLISLMKRAVEAATQRSRQLGK